MGRAGLKAAETRYEAGDDDLVLQLDSFTDSQTRSSQLDLHSVHKYGQLVALAFQFS